MRLFKDNIFYINDETGKTGIVRDKICTISEKKNPNGSIGFVVTMVNGNSLEFSIEEGNKGYQSFYEWLG